MFLLCLTDVQAFRIYFLVETYKWLPGTGGTKGALILNGRAGHAQFKENNTVYKNFS